VLRIKSTIDESNAILVSIEDSGPGIDPKTVDRIFDAFFTTKPRGMGMGLSICRSIIEAHNGRLTVELTSPHGSVFSVILPVSKGLR
jgi:signal transduction histidine kinase